MNFESLVKELEAGLRYIAVKLDGKYTSFDDHDLYQEAVLYLWQEYKKGALRGKNKSYILKGCLFHLKNYIRKNYKSLDANSISIYEDIGENSTLEDVVKLEDKRNRLEEVDFSLSLVDVGRKLREREKKVFELLLEGYTTREIGEILGISHVMVVKIKKKIKENYLKFKN
jgi:RNA polymerase sigma factor (sigma-70 family)